MAVEGVKKLKVIRKPTIEGKAERYQFDVSGSRFLIKNLSDGVVICKILGSEVVIPANTSQSLATRLVPTIKDLTSVIEVVPEKSNELGVEIQCLDY